jgi:hypothetical protein
MPRRKSRQDASLNYFFFPSSLGEIVGELFYMMSSIARAREPDEIRTNIKLLAAKLRKALYSKHEFYLYRTEITVHPMTKLPRGVKLLTGKKDELRHINIDHKTKNILRKAKEYNDKIIIAETHRDKDRKIIGFSWITDHLPGDLRKFWKKKDAEIYTKLTYIEEKHRKLGLLKNIIRFRDTQLRKDKKTTKLALVDRKNRRMNQIFQNTGKKPIAILESIRIFGVYKKVNFKEIN